jgi:hypothetical protein
LTAFAFFDNFDKNLWHLDACFLHRFYEVQTAHPKVSSSLMQVPGFGQGAIGVGGLGAQQGIVRKHLKASINQPKLLDLRGCNRRNMMEYAGVL